MSGENLSQVTLEAVFSRTPKKSSSVSRGSSPASKRPDNQDEFKTRIPVSPPGFDAVSGPSCSSSSFVEQEIPRTFLKILDCPLRNPLFASDDHTILFDVESLNAFFPPSPVPPSFQDVVNNDCVEMPCSTYSCRPTQEESCGGWPPSRWKRITESLRRPMQSTIDVEEAIRAYNKPRSPRWKFDGLHRYYTEFLSTEEATRLIERIIPGMVDLALSLPHVCTQAIPLLRRGKSHTVTMSQHQASCLLANAFFCTFPPLPLLKDQTSDARFPEINFCRFFEYNAVCFQKLRCIFHYFERVLAKKPSGVISFSRQTLAELPRWAKSDNQLRALHVSALEPIEDCGIGFTQVDFANAYIGGGVLRHGCVQEEIRFLICPELIVSLLFTERFQADECLIISGFERYSYYAGYARTFQWIAPYYDDTPRDYFQRRAVELVAIDARYYHHFRDQFKPKWILRDLNKAYVGFHCREASPGQLPAVTTGNWGCGVYRGCCQLKSIIQLLAAAEAGRDMIYCAFGNGELAEQLFKIHFFLRDSGCTVGQICGLLVQYCDLLENGQEKLQLFEFLNEQVNRFLIDSDEGGFSSSGGTSA